MHLPIHSVEILRQISAKLSARVKIPTPADAVRALSRLPKALQDVENWAAIRLS
jgi:hypothetical protein